MSKGNVARERARLLVKALLDYEGWQGDKPISKLKVIWPKKVDRDLNITEEIPDLEVDGTKQSLFYLVQDIPGFTPRVDTTRVDTTEEQLKKIIQLKKVIGEVIVEGLDRHLGILTCDRRREKEQKAAGEWKFTLKLWHKNDIDGNLEKLVKLWDEKRSPHSVASDANTNITHSTVIGIIENVENLEIHNNTGGSPAPQPERVAAPRREHVRFRGFNEIRAVTVWEGREQVLGELGQKVRDGLRVLAITGQGGIGKSSLASKLMEVLGIGLQPPSLGADCPYSGVVYYKVQVGTSFDDGAGQLLRDLGEEQGQDLVKPQEKIDQIITYLAGQKWLLVLDNLEDILHPGSHEQAGRAVSPEWGQLLNALVYKNHCSQVIITSREMPVDLGDLRYKVKPDSSLVETVVIPGVSVEAGVKILQRQLKDKLEDLQWMAERVGGSVFLLNQLVALGKGKPGYLRKNPKLVTKNAEPMLREQLNRQTAAAQDFLTRMSILRGAVDSRGLTFVRLFVDEWQERLMAAATVNQPLEFSDEEVSETEELLEKLVDSSLVESKFDEEKSEDVYSLHQLTRDFLGKQKQELPDLFIKTNDFYRTEFTFQNFNSMADLQILVTPIIFAFNIRDDKETATLNEKMMKYSIRLGQGDFFEDAMMQALQMAEGSNQTEGYLVFGKMHYDLGNWDEAERCFLAALDQANLENNLPKIASSQEYLGYIANVRGNWDEAERLYHQSLEIETELGDRSGIATTSEFLGYIANVRGNWDEAERLYQQSLEIEIELGDRSGMASSRGHLGDIARNRGNWNEAERLYRQYLEVMTELGDRSGMASSWGLLGDIARNRGNWDEAERLYRQSLEVETELGDQNSIAGSIGSLGEVELGRGDLDQAEEFLTDALKRFQELGNIQFVAEVAFRIAQLWRKRGNLDLAQQHYTTATTIFQNLGAAKELERIQQEWSIPPSPP